MKGVPLIYPGICTDTYFNPAQEDKTVHMTVDRDGQEIDLAFKLDVSVRYLLGFNRSDASSMEVESLIQGMPLEEAGLQAGM